MSEDCVVRINRCTDGISVVEVLAIGAIREQVILYFYTPFIWDSAIIWNGFGYLWYTIFFGYCVSLRHCLSAKYKSWAILHTGFRYMYSFLHRNVSANHPHKEVRHKKSTASCQLSANFFLLPENCVNYVWLTKNLVNWSVYGLHFISTICLSFK